MAWLGRAKQSNAEQSNTSVVQQSRRSQESKQDNKFSFTLANIFRVIKVRLLATLIWQAAQYHVPLPPLQATGQSSCPQGCISGWCIPWEIGQMALSNQSSFSGLVANFPLALVHKHHCVPRCRLFPGRNILYRCVVRQSGHACMIGIINIFKC